MKPVDFPDSNVVYAKDQTSYLPLPSYRHPCDPQGEVISCWQLDWRERLRVLFTGRIFWSQWTFGLPLQPQRASLDFKPVIWAPDLPVISPEANASEPRHVLE